MIYSKTDLWNLLEESQVVTKITGGYLLSEVFSKFLGNYKTSLCIGYPEDYKGLSDDTIYNKVMVECKVPMIGKASGDTYMLHTKNKEAIVKLKQMLQTPVFDYKQFVTATRYYYTLDIAQQGFARYIISKTWETINPEGGNNDTERGRKGII